MFKIDVSVPQNEQVVGVKTTNNRGFTPDELALIISPFVKITFSLESQGRYQQ